jgi:hypothetical protein
MDETFNEPPLEVYDLEKMDPNDRWEQVSMHRAWTSRIWSMRIWHK